MNQMTSQTGQSLIPDSTSVITTIHLGLIVVIAILAVLVILWGMRQKSRRRAAEHKADERIAEAADQREVQVDTNEAPGDAIARPAAPVPVAPTPVAPTPIAPTPVTPTPVAPASTREVEPDPTSGSSSAPIAATAIPGASPAMEAASAPSAPPSAAPAAFANDPVTQLKGLGPKVAARMAEHGVTTIGQIAALDEGSAAALDAALGPFAGLMAADRWIEQARLLATGDRAGFEAVFGRL